MSGVPNVSNQSGVTAFLNVIACRPGSGSTSEISTVPFHPWPVTGVMTESEAPGNTRHRSDSLTHAVEHRQPILSGGLGSLRVQRHDQHAIGLESKRPAGERHEGPHEESGGRDENDRQRDLCDHQAAAHARVALIGRASAMFFDGFHRVYRGCAKGGRRANSSAVIAVTAIVNPSTRQSSERSR